MPIFLLIRHGENEYVKKGRLAGRLPGVHLNDIGRAQSNALADKLAGVKVKAIYSSPLERTMETAAPIAQGLNLEVIPRQGLIETDYGEWQDQRIKGLTRLKLWRRVHSSPSTMRFPGGETFAEAQFRITRELIDLATQNEPKDILICVSHADPIKLAVAYFIGLPLDMFQRLNVSPGSVTGLHLDENGGRLLYLSSAPSLTFPKI